MVVVALPSVTLCRAVQLANALDGISVTPLGSTIDFRALQLLKAWPPRAVTLLPSANSTVSSSGQPENISLSSVVASPPKVTFFSDLAPRKGFWLLSTFSIVRLRSITSSSIGGYQLVESPPKRPLVTRRALVPALMVNFFRLEHWLNVSLVCGVVTPPGIKASVIFLQPLKAPLPSAVASSGTG